MGQRLFTSTQYGGMQTTCRTRKKKTYCEETLRQSLSTGAGDDGRSAFNGFNREVAEKRQ